MTSKTENITLDFERYNELIKKEVELDVARAVVNDAKEREKAFISEYKKLKKLNKADISLFTRDCLISVKDFPDSILAVWKKECIEWLQKEIIKIIKNEESRS